MKIGIPKEIKTGECRVALIPEHVRQLVKGGHTVWVERDAGKQCRFPNRQYEKAGARICDGVYDCRMIVRVKEPPQATIRKNQIIMGYLHVEKGQNQALLHKLMGQHTTSYAYEEIRDARSERLVNLGFEAGVVGAYEGLFWHGRIIRKHGLKTLFTELKPIRTYHSIKEIYQALKKAKVHEDATIYILGKGRVSSGAQTVLDYLGIKPRVLYRRQTANIEKYLPKADIIINAVDWYPHEPRIITEEMLQLMKNTSLIVDISCDENGAIESCIPTTWQKPTYSFEGITHICIDNLPTAVPRDASIHLSTMILPHVFKVANGETLKTGMMTKDGEFTYVPLQVISRIKEKAAPRSRKGT